MRLRRSELLPLALPWIYRMRPRRRLETIATRARARVAAAVGAVRLEMHSEWHASRCESDFPTRAGRAAVGAPTANDTRLDHYIDRYAARAHGMTASAIRALFAVANRPEVVSLAGGMPNITDLPLDVVGSVLNDLVLNDGRRAMQYGSGQGEPAIREAICDVMRLENISAHPDDVMVSVGSQQGLDLLTRIFCNPGDVVICEAPSYVGALGVFRSYQCEVVHVAMDEQGLNPSALADALRRCAGQAVPSNSSTPFRTTTTPLA